MELIEKQKYIYELVKKADMGIFTIAGFAGTGKTITVAEITKLKKFKNILCVAPTASALAVLKNKIPTAQKNKTIKFTTLSSLIDTPTEVFKFANQVFYLDPDLGDKDKLYALFAALKLPTEIITEGKKIVKFKNGNIAEKPLLKINEHLLQQSLTEQGYTQLKDFQVDAAFITKSVESIVEELAPYDLIPIDEASMVNAESMELLEKAINTIHEKRNSMLLVCGDPGQAEPIEGGLNKYMDPEYTDDKKVTLTKILRSDDDVAQVGYDIRIGGKLPLLALKYNNIKVINNDLRAFINKYKQDLMAADVTLAFKNKTVNQLNAAIRALKGFSGPVSVNEKVVVHQNSGYKSNGSIAFANGDILTVKEVMPFDAGAKFYEDTINEVIEKENINNILSDSVKIRTKASIELIKAYLQKGDFLVVNLVNRLGEAKHAVVLNNLDLTQKSAIHNDVIAMLNDVTTLTSSATLPYVKAGYGYAITIHKAQGSEWDKVVVVALASDYYLYKTPNVLYTAATRAKKEMAIYYLNEQ